MLKGALQLYICKVLQSCEAQSTDHVHTQPGQKGAGRTLLTLALNNQDKPNTVDNTDIIIAYDGDERTSNLQIVSSFKRIDIHQTRLLIAFPFTGSWQC